MTCGLCKSDGRLVKMAFDGGAIQICTACYNNPLLRDQISAKFKQLFERYKSGDGAALERIKALARQYKMPEPEVLPR